MYFTYILIQKKKYFNNINKIWPCIKFHKKINNFSWMIIQMRKYFNQQRHNKLHNETTILIGSFYQFNLRFEVVLYSLFLPKSLHAFFELYSWLFRSFSSVRCLPFIKHINHSINETTLSLSRNDKSTSPLRLMNWDSP